MVNFFWFEVVYPVKPKAAWSADAARIKRINRAAKLRFVRLAFHGEREREKTTALAPATGSALSMT